LPHAAFHSSALLALFSTCLSSWSACRARAPPTCCTLVTLGVYFVASSSLLRSTFFRAHSRLQLKAVLLVQSVNVAELPRARYCSNAAVFSVELTVRTEVRHHHRRRGPVGTTTPSWCAFRREQIPAPPDAADVVPRESCPGVRARDRSVDPPPTTGSPTLRAGPRNQRRRPGRFHPSADRHVRDSHVLRRRQRRCSAAPLLCCSARCFGDIYVLCTASSVLSLF